MIKLKGIAISEGVAFGKIHIFRDEMIFDSECDIESKELEKFNAALDLATKDINQEIEIAKQKFDARVAEIFEAHKFIINDPLLLEKTIAKIKKGKSAINAYDEAIHEFITVIRDSDNEYILARIIDIIDATDKVKSLIGSANIAKKYLPKQETIMAVKELKPSLIFSRSDKRICGYMAAEGYIHQHSGIIARMEHVPCVIIPDLFKHIKEGQRIIIDGYNGEAILDPTDKFIKDFERSYDCEL